MSVTVRAWASASGQTSVACAKPTGTAQDDVLVAHVGVGAGGTATAPAGWTQVDASGGASSAGQTFYKVAGASEASTYTFTSGASIDLAIGIVAVVGANTTSPINAHAVDAAPTYHATTNLPALTTTVANCLLLGFWQTYNSSSLSPDAPLTALWNPAGPAPFGERAFAAYESLSAAGAVPTRGATQAGFAPHGVEAIAIAPAVPANQRTISSAGGNWNATTAWAEGIVPTAADDVVATGTSGPLTINTSAAVCRSIDLTGYTNTLTHSSVTLTIGTSSLGPSGVALKLVAGMTYTPSGASSRFTFASTVTGNTITTAGKALQSMTFNGVAGGWTLQDSLSLASSLTLTAGALDTNGVAVSMLSLQTTGAGAKTLTLGASAVTVTSTSAGGWQNTASTPATVNGGTSTINLSGGSLTQNFDGGGQSYYDLVMTAGLATFSMTGANSFHNLTITGPSSKTGLMTIAANQTITGTLTVAGNSTVNRYLVSGNVLGTARTLTAAAVSLSNADFMDITGAGGASPFTGTSLGNAGGNSGITFPASVTRYMVGGGSWSDPTHWSTTSGGAGGASIPLPHDDVRLDASTLTCTVDMPRACRNLDCTGHTGTFTVSTTTGSFYGSATFVAGQTFGAGFGWIYRGRGSHTLTMGGHSVPGTVNFSAPGGTYTLQDNFAASSNVNHLAGTIDANGHDVSASFYFSSGTVTRQLNMGSGTWTMTSSSGWDASSSTGLTINAASSTIAFTYAGASATTFDTGGLTYNNVVATTASTGELRFNASATFNNITVSGGTRTLRLGNATGDNPVVNGILSVQSTSGAIVSLRVYDTLTVNGTWDVDGRSGARGVVNSYTVGTQKTIHMPTGIVGGDYLDIKDIKADSSTIIAMPSVRAYTRTITTASQPFNVTIPASAQTGDYLVVYHLVKTNVAVTPATGWTERADVGITGSTNWRLAVYTKSCGASDAGTTVGFSPTVAANNDATSYCFAIKDVRVSDGGFLLFGSNNATSGFVNWNGTGFLTSIRAFWLSLINGKTIPADSTVLTADGAGTVYLNETTQGDTFHTVVTTDQQSVAGSTGSQHTSGPGVYYYGDATIVLRGESPIYAGANSVDSGNNIGWLFASAPVIAPTGIASAAAVGGPSLTPVLAPTGIGPGAVGTPTIARDVFGPTVTIVAPADGATESGTFTMTVTATDASGVASVAYAIRPGPSQWGEPGPPTLHYTTISGPPWTTTLDVTGSPPASDYELWARARDVGNNFTDVMITIAIEAVVDLTISPSGIASTAAIGTPTLTPVIAPTGIASGAAVGAPVMILTLLLTPVGIESAETFGTPIVVLGAIEPIDPIDPDPIQDPVPDDFEVAWSSASTTTLRPMLVTEIRRGRWNRGYRSIAAAEEIDADIPGESRSAPWMAWWDAAEAWRGIDGVTSCQLAQSFDDQNGVDVATVVIENTRLAEQTGVGGNYRAFQRGYLSPDRGYVSAYGAAGGSATEWEGELARMAEIRIWQGYGDPQRNEDGTMPDSGGPNGGWVFHGWVDDSNVDVLPDTITLTARNGKPLTDERVFGWNKSKQIDDPVVFGDRLGADDLKLVGSDADASSVGSGHPASYVLDGKNSTAWWSANHTTAGNTEWVQIRLPAGRYTDFILNPTYGGMEYFVGVYLHGDAITVDGASHGEGWLDPDGTSVPGGNGGWPYIKHSDAISDRQFTRSLGHELVVGDNTILRVGFRNLHQDGSDYRAAVTRLQGRKRAIAGAGAWNEVTPGVAIPDYDNATDTNGKVTVEIPVTGDGTAGTIDVAVYVTHSYVSDLKITLKSPSGTSVVIYDGAGGGGADLGNSAGDPLVIASGAATALPTDTTDNMTGPFKPAHSLRTLESKTLAGTWKLVFEDQAGGDTGVVQYAALRFGSPVRDWILVDDVADVVRTVLRWAGYREMMVESTGARLAGHSTFNRTTFLGEIIQKAVEQTGYSFFLTRPFRGSGLEVPVFRMPSPRKPVTAHLSQVTENDLLTDVSYKHTDEPLSYIIRVRGKESSSGDTLGGGMTRRVMAVYRPPWSHQLSGDPGPDRLGGLIKHEVLTRPELTSVAACLKAAKLIAFWEAIAASTAVVDVPGHFGFQLDDQIVVVDTSSALASRLWVASRESNLTTGEQAVWTVSLTGTPLDTPDIAAAVAELDEEDA